MIEIELPEATVQDVKVLIRKKPPLQVDVILLVQPQQTLQKSGLHNVTEEQRTRIAVRAAVKYPLDHRLCIPRLKLWCLAEEGQPGMKLQYAIQDTAQVLAF